MSDALSTEIAAVEQQVGTPSYWADQGLQSRYRGLLDARDTGAAVPAKPGPAAQRIAEIEKLMRDPRGGYWRGPNAAALQAEYRALLEGDAADASAGGAEVSGPADRAVVAAETGDWRATPAQARGQLPAGVVSEWDHGGAFDQRLARAQQAAASIAGAIGDTGQALHFFESFAALPDGARAAVLTEAAIGAPTFIEPAGEDELAFFRSIEGGRELLDTWGRDAPRNAARTARAFENMRARMADEDWKAFVGWFRDLTTMGRMAFLWKAGT